MNRAVASVRLALLALTLPSCARNAILEVEITVPPQPDGPPRYAVVQFESGEVAFEQDWRRSTDYPGVELTEGEQTLRYSVISENPGLVLQVKVLFCLRADCSAIDDAPDRAPALWYRLQRAFYIGRRTRWRQTIGAVPSRPPESWTEIDRCAIEGCIHGGGGETSYCRLSGEHYCE